MIAVAVKYPEKKNIEVEHVPASVEGFEQIIKAETYKFNHLKGFPDNIHFVVSGEPEGLPHNSFNQRGTILFYKLDHEKNLISLSLEDVFNIHYMVEAYRWKGAY